jgi:tetratricopeptide (TPR) repeat protein
MYLFVFLLISFFLILYTFFESQVIHQAKALGSNIGKTINDNKTVVSNLKTQNNSNNIINLEGALRLYDKALSIQSNSIDILSNKGMLLIILKRYDEANKVFDKVLSIDPNNVAGLYNKGVALEKIGNTFEANKYYTLALKINPNYKPDLINRISRPSINELSPEIAAPLSFQNNSYGIQKENLSKYK